MSDPEGVLVVAPNWLGDAVMALPALADVRRAYAQARLVVAARPSIAPLYSMVPGVDSTIVTHWRGAMLDWKRLQGDVRQIAAEGITRAILLPNSFASAWAVRRAGVRERWGYAADRRSLLLTRAVRRPRRSRHQSVYYQHLIRELGIPSGPLEPVLSVPASAIEQARGLLVAHGWKESGPLLVAAPGAAYGTAKRWLPSHFAALITRAARETGAQTVLVGASGDAPSTRLVLQSMGAAEREAVIDLTGATTLQSLAGVMSLGAACVSNDSGAMHLAGAVGIPLAALFGPTRERETSPLTRRGGRADVLIHHVWCRPCMLRECPFDHQCMKNLKPERVFETVRVLMGTKA